MPDHAGYESRLRELEHISEAARIQISPSAVTQFEKGKAKPKPETLIRLALALGVPPEFFAAEPLPELPSPADVEDLALAVRDAWNLGQGPIPTGTLDEADNDLPG